MEVLRYDLERHRCLHAWACMGSLSKVNDLADHNSYWTNWRQALLVVAAGTLISWNLIVFVEIVTCLACSFDFGLVRGCSQPNLVCFVT